MKISFDFIDKLCFTIVIFILPLLFHGQNSYDFLVGGHAYGDHLGTNNGLHPPFLEDLGAYLLNNNPDFIVLAGDIVRNGTTAQWNAVADELDDLNLPSYYVMGNHDNTADGIDVFEEKHGDTFYSFMQGPDLFIMLDQEISYRSISSAQIIYLQEQLNSLTYRNVFLFFHMLLWNGDAKYASVPSNLGSQYALMSPYSNYWEEVYPILNEYNNHDIYVITGDVGGRPDVISSYYDRCGHIRMIATGMGEAPEENFMAVEVTESEVLFSLYPLDESITLAPLEEQTFTIPLVFDLTPNEEVHLCEGENITFEVTMNETFSFFWAVEDVLIGDDSLNYTTEEENTYSFTATDETCVVKQERYVFVHEPIDIIPVITFDTIDLSCNCPDQALWFFNDILIENETNNTLTPTSNGIYTVACGNEGCISEVSDEYIFDVSDINNFNTSEFSIFFDGNSNSLVVISPTLFNEIIIYDLLGKKIKQLHSVSNKTSLNIYNKGSFIVQIISKSGSYSKQIIIP